MRQFLEGQQKLELLHEHVSSPEEVQYYSHHYLELAQSQRHKAECFVRLGKIVYEPSEKIFLCLPIQGYNTRTYRLVPREGKVECNCQGYQKKLKLYGEGCCSHQGALYLFWKLEHLKKTNPLEGQLLFEGLRQKREVK
jgi:hypothetical protein